MRAVVALDIGGTKTAASVVTPDGAVLSVVDRPTRAIEGPEVVLDVAAAAAREAIAAADRLEGAGRLGVEAVGVGTAGMVDGAGRIVGATATFRDWIGTDVATGLARRLDLPVVVCNDVDAHAAGESWQGSTAGAASSLFIAVGTGVGAGSVVNGTLVRGAHGGAGEIGHMPSRLAAGFACPCGRTGHLEAVVAGPGIVSVYRATGGVETCGGTREVFRRAREGDRSAIAAVERSAEALGEAVAAAITVIDPEVVALGGGLALASERWWEVLTSAVRDQVVPPHDGVELVRARLGPTAALVGAARNAWQTFC